MIKVIFFDVDGTLFSHKQNDVPASTRNVLNQLKENETMIRNNLTDCKIIRWNPRAIDIISQTGGKTTGIKAYLKTMEISADETMAFGDAGNDIDMLEFVHIGVAMGNATDKVKAHADFVTASVDEDGIEKALFLIDVKGGVP